MGDLLAEGVEVCAELRVFCAEEGKLAKKLLAGVRNVLCGVFALGSDGPRHKSLGKQLSLGLCPRRSSDLQPVVLSKLRLPGALLLRNGRAHLRRSALPRRRRCSAHGLPGALRSAGLQGLELRVADFLLCGEAVRKAHTHLFT